jgi:hypothetical protein
MGGIMSYTIEMGSGAMLHIPSFIKFGIGIQKLLGRDTGTQQGDVISPLLFFQYSESRLTVEQCLHLSSVEDSPRPGDKGYNYLYKASSVLDIINTCG